MRHLALSGEPKFDAAGVFAGYWGVGRDVTAQVRAQQAMSTSEMRYRTLFTRSPSAMVLHRRGTVLDANAAAARLFGYRDADGDEGRQPARPLRRARSSASWCASASRCRNGSRPARRCR